MLKNAREESNAYYDLITDLSKKIGDLKGYDYGYSSPKAGMMIVSYKGHNFLITAEALSRTEDASISDELTLRHSEIAYRDFQLDQRLREQISEEKEGLRHE